MDHARSAHYDQTAAHFDANWSYSDPYLDWMTEEIRAGLRPRPGSTVLDVGSRTGLCARRLVEGAPAAARIVYLDPSPATLPHPLFSQALRRFGQEQPHFEEIVQVFEEAVLDTSVRTASFRPRSGLSPISIWSGTATCPS